MSRGTQTMTLTRALQGTAEEFDALRLATALTLEVRSRAETEQPEGSLPEVVAIQRLISLSRGGASIRVIWARDVSEHVAAAPALYPLQAVLLLLDGVEHVIEEADGTRRNAMFGPARRKIYGYLPSTDLFADRQALLCADTRGQGRPSSLYSSETGQLLSRADFDSLISEILSAQTAVNVSSTRAFIFRQTVSTIVAELFENAELHGRAAMDGTPIKKSGIRGIIFHRIQSHAPAQARSAASVGSAADVLEISVFDAGLGFYGSYSGQPLQEEVPLEDEWEVVHQCMLRHFEDDVSGVGPSHRGMGLYEVLRGLKVLGGRIEVRTGRVYGYRTFMQGEPKLLLEAQASRSRPGMPKPRLLDKTRQFVTVPTVHEQLVGAAIRVLIPLD
ncbi:hypothetical protein [Cupriavidus oxalaticus]|nr:hypothetical protein [Cupriavidus oxalaticus]